MEVKNIYPPVTPFLEVKLDQEVIDYLWKIINLGKTKNINFKNNLIGNISQSILLDDQDDFFYKSSCIPLIKFFRENNYGKDPVSVNTLLGPKSQLVLNKLWVNYQYKTEFNPYHDHSGVYSFAVWMKIPYDCNEQKKLPLFTNMKESNIRAGFFEFEYFDCLGSIKNLEYTLSEKYEGYMVFFPAKLRHCVYPFYGTEEPRISISGNISYLPV